MNINYNTISCLIFLIVCVGVTILIENLHRFSNDKVPCKQNENTIDSFLEYTLKYSRSIEEATDYAALLWFEDKIAKGEIISPNDRMEADYYMEQRQKYYLKQLNEICDNEEK